MTKKTLISKHLHPSGMSVCGVCVCACACSGSGCSHCIQKRKLGKEDRGLGVEGLQF